MKILMFVTASIISTTVMAQPDSAKSCVTCHAVDRKLVGPSFKDISSKYQGKADYVAKKIKSGGKGVWGPIPMPAQPNLSDAQAKELADWILKQ